MRSGTKVIDSVRPALGEIIMFFNLRHAQLGKKEVRHAIAHAVDRGQLVKLALNGRGTGGNGADPQRQSAVLQSRRAEISARRRARQSTARPGRLSPPRRALRAFRSG